MTPSSTSSTSSLVGDGLPELVAVGRLGEHGTYSMAKSVTEKTEAQIDLFAWAKDLEEERASWRGHTGLSAAVALMVPPLWEQRARSAALSAGVDPARLVVVSPPVRVRRRPRPAATPPLLQRGRKRPVPAPGVLLQRGRERTRLLKQAELNERAGRLALEFVACHRVS